MHSEFDFDPDFNRKGPGPSLFIILSAVIVLLLGIIVALLISRGKSEKASTPEEAVPVITEVTAPEEETTMDALTEDPQEVADGSMLGDAETEVDDTPVDISQVLSNSTVSETGDITYGIDVSRYQGTIDFAQVAASGIQFVMVRLGYRNTVTGEIEADVNAKYNLQEAVKNGMQVGGYFYSGAITEAEAVEEADWVADFVSRYPITYPIAYDFESYENYSSRQSALSYDERNNIATAFLNQTYDNGYTPMFYSSRNALRGNYRWQTDLLQTKYKIWIAQYSGIDSGNPDYTGAYSMWQYTDKGQVPGIIGNVDLDIAYFGYDGTEDAKNSEAPETAHADPEALMTFTDTEDSVTAKDSCNLRNMPNTQNSHVVHELKNGEVVTRTGYSEAGGWSRVVYDGQTLYVLTRLITTDLTAKPVTPEPAPQPAEPDNGIKTKFQACDDTLTPKIEVNLRSLPSVTNAESTVVATIKCGETVHRTGVNHELGWSRVEYNGQVLYCVTSYMTPYNPPQ